MKLDPMGIVYAIFNSGPSGQGIPIPIGSCVFFDPRAGVCLTASHVIEQGKRFQIKSEHVEIKPTFACFGVGVEIDNGWQIFYVAEYHEILTEVTALYIHKKSVNNVVLPQELAFPLVGSSRGKTGKLLI